MSYKKVTIPPDSWVWLSATLANYILEYSLGDEDIWIDDGQGGQVRTEERQDEYEALYDLVEGMMRVGGLRKGDQ